MEKARFITIITVLFTILALSFAVAEVNNSTEPVSGVEETSSEDVAVNDSAGNDSAVDDSTGVSDVEDEPAPVEDSSFNSQSMAIVYDNVKCRTEFTIKLVGFIVSIDPSAISLSSSAASLQSDLANLESYSSEGDSSGFYSYMADSYNPNFKELRSEISDWKNSTTASPRDKLRLRGDYAVLMAGYRTCNTNTIRDYGNLRVTAFNAILDEYQAKTNKMSEAGVDVDLMNQVLVGATKDIVNELQNALDDAQDAQQMHDAVKGYCLYDGCKEGDNFHLQAKFELAKLKTLAIMIEDREDSYKVSGNLSELKSSLTAAESALDEVGTSAYTDDSKREVWDNLNSAASAAKEIKKVLGGN
jgi:hypothetical protein